MFGYQGHSFTVKSSINKSVQKSSFIVQQQYVGAGCNGCHLLHLWTHLPAPQADLPSTVATPPPAVPLVGKVTPAAGPGPPPQPGEQTWLPDPASSAPVPIKAGRAAGQRDDQAGAPTLPLIPGFRHH